MEVAALHAEHVSAVDVVGKLELKPDLRLNEFFRLFSNQVTKVVLYINTEELIYIFWTFKVSFTSFNNKSSINEFSFY